MIACHIVLGKGEIDGLHHQHLAGDGEAEARVGAEMLRLWAFGIEALENRFLLPRRNARPVILDGGDHAVAFDMDELLRGDMLQRFQAYRIGREIGVYNANELRGFEGMNPRTDAAAAEFLSPLNMQPEQTGAPKE